MGYNRNFRDGKFKLQNFFYGNRNVVDMLHSHSTPLYFTFLKQDNRRNVLNFTRIGNVRKVIDINFDDADIPFILLFYLF